MESGTLLDVGARSHARQGEQRPATYRELLPPGWTCTGLDLEPGDNVDLVPAHPHLWRELDDAAFDACVAGQVFEHDPLFWITAAEMARVTRPGGLIVVIAPSRGPRHRFPIDCWRFHPDAWAALARYLGLELLETDLEEPDARVVEPGAMWGDATAVFRRPRAGDAGEPRLVERWTAIAETARDLDRSSLASPPPGPGPALERYRRSSRLPLVRALVRRLGAALSPRSRSRRS